jgi:protein-tyrosine phosphatase
MAAALFARETQHLADPVEVSSAGVLNNEGISVPGEVLEVMAPFGVDLRNHRSRTLNAPLLEHSDLIVGMGGRHVQEAILLDPPSWPQSFTLKGLVRRSGEIGPRRRDQSVGAWIESAHGDRTRASMAQRRPDEDVADPYGRSLERYRATAAELAQLTAQLAVVLWPDEVRHSA